MVRKRPRVEPTEDFQQILPLCWWPEQVEYERMRQPVLFGSSVAERARETGVSESTLRRRIGRFEDEGMEGLFATEKAKRRKLPTNIRRLIVDLKAEYPPFNLNEIANIVGACFGRKPDVRSVKRVLDEEALPLKLERSYPRYHEMEAASPGQGRAAVVELRVDGWSAKAIAGHLGMGRSTVYKVLGRFKEEGAEGLADKPYGRPVGVRKVTLAAIEEVRKLARNPQIGAFRVHAALKQNGFDLSRTTCGRILAQVREIYGYDTPKSGGGSKKAMPFASERHHQYWTADVRYLDMLGEELLAEGMVYAVTIMENYSRAMLASSVTRRQDLNAFLDVLYRAGYRNMVRPRRSSPTLAPSFWPIGRRPSTGLWASASWRSRGDNPLAELPGNSLGCPEEDGRPLLRKSPRLERAARRARSVDTRLQPPGALRPPAPQGRQTFALRGALLGQDVTLPGGRPRPGVLLGPLHAYPRRPRLSHPPTLQALRRGGARRDRGSGVDGRGCADRRVWWRGALALRGRVRPPSRRKLGG